MPNDQARATELQRRLERFEADYGALPGICGGPERRMSLLRQFVDSGKRTLYVRAVSNRDISPNRLDPLSGSFDPILGAALARRQGQFDEACWLAFLSVHFGKHAKSGWELCRTVYAGDKPADPWRWARVRTNVDELGHWVSSHSAEILTGPPRRAFGNHRKYQSLGEANGRGTPAAIQSYVSWVEGIGGHRALFSKALEHSFADPYAAFDLLFRDMACVISFGRLARFDYLSLIGKLDLALIEAGSTYLSNSTGPIRGARQLFGVDQRVSVEQLEKRVVMLARALGLTMQDMEDALCNWQKSPDRYQRFRG